MFNQVQQLETNSRIAHQVMVFKKPTDVTLGLNGNISFEKKDLRPEEKRVSPRKHYA